MQALQFGELKYQTAHKKKTVALMVLQIAASVLDLYYFNADFFYISRQFHANI